MRQVAGQHSAAGATLGIHHRDQFACRRAVGLGFHDHTVQGSDKLRGNDRLRQKIARTGLHCQAHAFPIVQQATHQKRRALMGRALQQGRQFLTPQLANAQQQEIGHPVQPVQRVAMPIAHLANIHLQAGDALTDFLQLTQGQGVRAADQQTHPGFDGGSGYGRFPKIQHGVISGTTSASV
ncbi:hypothetical protein D3C75_815730 [compost metagenome]